MGLVQEAIIRIANRANKKTGSEPGCGASPVQVAAFLDSVAMVLDLDGFDSPEGCAERLNDMFRAAAETCGVGLKEGPPPEGRCGSVPMGHPRCRYVAGHAGPCIATWDQCQHTDRWDGGGAGLVKGTCMKCGQVAR
jgi:hypothetical protein